MDLHHLLLAGFTGALKPALGLLLRSARSSLRQFVVLSTGFPHGDGLLAPRGNLPPAVQVACGARHCKVRAHGDEVLSRPRGASLRKATLICSASRGVR